MNWRAVVAGEILYLNPRAIEANRDNVRRECGDIVGLAESIREHGVLQPLGVVHRGSVYEVVYGDRRREAAIVVGLDRVPCLLLGDLDDDQRLIRNMLENLQRLELNDIEKARAFEKMREKLLRAGMERGAVIETMCRRLGLSASQIKRYLGLLELAPSVQNLIAAGDLTVTQAQHLRPLSPAARQEAVGMLAAEEHLSAAELSRLAAALARNPNVDPAEALEKLRRGEEISDLSRPERNHGPLHLPPRPSIKADDEELLEDRSAAEAVEDQEADPAGPRTRDGNRVRKVRSLDSFLDEADRLARCVQDGDLAKLVAADPEGALKLRLVAKQLAFLSRAVGEMAGQDSA